MSAHTGALEAVDRILNRGGDDAVTRVVRVLHERVFAWVALVGADGEILRETGEQPAGPQLSAPAGTAELRAAPRIPNDADGPLRDRVALLLSAHVPHG